MALFSFMKFPKCMNTMWLLQPGIFLAPGLSLQADYVHSKVGFERPGART